MPFVLAPFVAVSLGALFAMALPTEKSSDELRARRIAWLFALLSLAPNVAYFLCLSPDWSVGYLVRAGRLPSAVLLLCAVGTASLAPAAHSVAVGWLRAGDGRRAVGLAFAGAFAALIVATVLAHRLWLVGTYAEYHGGGAMAALGATGQGLAVLVFDVLTAAGVAVALARPESPTGEVRPTSPSAARTASPAPRRPPRASTLR